MSPEHSHAGALNPTVSACGGGAFGKELSVDEIMRGAPQDGISALLRRDTRELASFSLCHVRTQ